MPHKEIRVNQGGRGKEQVENGKDLIGISWKNSLNKSRSEQFEREHSSVSEGGMGRRHGIFKESESNNLVHASSSQAKASSTAVVPQPLPGGLSVTDAGLIQVDPVVINDNWVCCDVCEKWRLLPCGMEPSALPKKWLCRMLDWLPNMNHCDVSEDTTTQALYSMYAAQLGQGQNDANQEHDAEVGDAPSKKLKRKSVDELGHKHAKKAKAGDAKCPNGNFLENANVIEQVGLGVGGTSAKLSGHRGNQRIGSCSPKEFRDEIIEGSLDADRRPKDQQQTSMQTDYSNFIPGSSGKRDHPTKKRKVRGWKEIQASQQDSAASMKEEHETEHTSPPKTKISKSEGMEHYVSKGDDKGERKGRAPRNFISSNRNLPKEMKEQNRGGFGKDHGMGRFCVREASQRSLDATDWLKRDMGPRQPFVSAISSSSKVGVCGSPVESVSSSPWRTAKLDNLPSDLRNSGVDDLMDVNHLPSCSPARFSDDGEPQCDCSRSVGEAKISWVKQSGSCENHTGVECTTNNTGRVSGKNGKRDVRQLSAAKTNHDNPYTDAEHSNIHLVNIVKSSEQQERISDQKRKQHGVQEKSREYNLIDSSNERRGVNELESTSLYFRAVLKFLHSASMLDLCNGNSDKQGETTQSMIVYTETARLCEFCALTYERNKEMAAAALAYKCMGVAHMRVAVAKNVLIRRDRHELQFVAQLVPPGESPSSPASDVDNLINHAVIHKDLSKNPARGVESAQVAGTPIFTARYHPHLRRILQFAQDVNSAVEAFAKADNAFISAKANMDDANCGPEGILAIKRAVDFSFHDVDGLLHLVRLAMEAIHH